MAVLPPQIIYLFLYMPIIVLSTIIPLSYRFLKPMIDKHIRIKRNEIYEHLIKWSSKLKKSPELSNELIEELYEQVDNLLSLERLTKDYRNFGSYLVVGSFWFLLSGVVDILNIEAIMVILPMFVGLLCWVLGCYYFLRIYSLL